MEHRPRKAGNQSLALTPGEPAGIGPDITLLAWLRRDELKLPPFYLLGDAAFIARRAKALGLAVPVAEVGAVEARAALASIRRAVADVRAGLASAVVTNPIAKSVLYHAGFKHPGHTEFLAELAAEHGRAPQPVMMLWSPALAVVPVTIHLSLREAITQLNTDLIVSTARIVAAGLKDRFGIARPRLALSGLNPHAGEDGSLGSENKGILAPAVQTSR